MTLQLSNNLYEGDLPYVFISYAHKDAELARLILEQFDERGIRVWYDADIHSGAIWADTIAMRVNKSAVFVALLTRNYIQSKHCMHELRYAVSGPYDRRSHNLETLAIFFEDVELPAGVELYLSNRQSIYHSHFSDDRRFYKKLFDSEIWEVCRDQKTNISAVLPGGDVAKREPSTFDRLLNLLGIDHKSTKRSAADYVFFFVAVLVLVVAILLNLKDNSSVSFDDLGSGDVSAASDDGALHSGRFDADTQ